MNQGFKVEFYAKVKFLKIKTTSTGNPFAFGVLSCWVNGNGYVNLPFKGFSNVANDLVDDTWIIGSGSLGNHSIQKEKMEVVISEFEFADEPERTDNTSKQKPTQTSKPKATKPQETVDELENELLGGVTISDEDFPF